VPLGYHASGVEGFDVNRFLRERKPSWRALEALLERAVAAPRGVSLAEMRRLGQLYRGVSSDLIRARSELLDASIIDYLNDLVARAYALVHGRRGRERSRVLAFLMVDFPTLFREERAAFGLAALLTFLGAGLGAAAVALDPTSLGVMIPDQHQAFTPTERVRREEKTGGNDDGQEALAFSSFLFTHNIQVSFFVFVLGITFGLGTAALLFYNGVPLGALAMQYHLEGQDLFFWSWILPHGIPELTEIFIAGAAGLVLGRALVRPGSRTRRDALVFAARRAVRLVVGGMPILVLAGLVEGTISQMHEPQIPYALKLVVAAIVGAGVYAYLLLAGRGAGEAASAV
jgi:uncharacterized membrane protein SpoIIM required for sporulation